ncbi:MAG: PKD domain-containing protein, partial [Gammaproteobacteria bacterium]|nr:PKD domain-containing protein [Gammaproteobacteria bacterium]
MNTWRWYKFFLIISISLQGSCGGGGGDDTTTQDSTSPQIENKAPVADAGTDQKFAFGSGVVTLSGSGSSDPDNDALSYNWTFVLVPGGSTATISNASGVSPAFTPDKTGLYRISLSVSDGVSTSQDFVEIDVANNSGPTANAGLDQDADINAAISLSGSASTDPDDDQLTYTWSQVPGYGPDVTNGSGSLTGVNPSFTAPAAPATILFDLRVNDGFGDSFADRVQINIFKQSSAIIFVSTTGSDLNSGTKLLPKRTIAAAIGAAQSVGGDVYLDSIAAFTPTAEIILQDGVSLYGGYNSNANWQRYDSDKTEIASSFSRVVSASAINANTVLDRLDISSSIPAPGISSYGLFVKDSSGLYISHSIITASATVNASSATSFSSAASDGENGGAGGPGCENSDLLCGTCSSPVGGTGGAGGYGKGGDGGLPGYALSNGDPGSNGTTVASLSGAGGAGTPNGLGNWNPEIPYVGRNGINGSDGADGAAGSQNFLSTGYAPGNGTYGATAVHGGNGGGGGGGGGGDSF